MKIPQRRRRPAMQSPQWSDASILRQRLKESQAAHAALIASLPARDQAIAQRYAQAAADKAAQWGADSAVRKLQERGLLREQPAKVGTIKTLIRDASGQVVGLTETAGQIEPEDGAA